MLVSGGGGGQSTRHFQGIQFKNTLPVIKLSVELSSCHYACGWLVMGVGDVSYKLKSLNQPLQVLWDKIIMRGEKTKLDLKSIKTKYGLLAITN